MIRACFYNHPGACAGTRPFSRNGKCLAFISHCFDDHKGPVAAAIVEDDKSGSLVVVRVGDVMFSIPGNLDKR